MYHYLSRNLENPAQFSVFFRVVVLNPTPTPPSSFWNVSRMEMIMRGTAQAVPFSVWANCRLPCTAVSLPFEEQKGDLGSLGTWFVKCCKYVA